VRVEAIIERPANDAADALLLYHGTVIRDRLVLQAAEDTLEGFRALLDRDDLLLVSVAYPEEGLLIGDNVAHAEAALLWVRRHAAEALGVTVGRVFLAGHSQGGYLVTRLNTLHAVDGVIANAPGPLDLVFRCRLEEDGRLAPGVPCGDLAAAHGSTRQDEAAYAARSLLAFTRGHRSDILFVQGLDDSPLQLRSWPLFRERMEACTDCRARTFLEAPGHGHQALFDSAEARRAFNGVLRAR
jgi:pimeloyl-ACP methyl ester carboxylesterase